MKELKNSGVRGAAREFSGSRLDRYSSRYLLYLPSDYEMKPRRRWPLLLFLHGAGERGSRLSRVAKQGLPRIVERAAEFPMVIVAPQCPAGQTWSTDRLLPFLDYALKEFHVDRRRVFLTGLSMGGYGAWSLGLSHPERFAAIAPICGGGEILPALLSSGAKLRRLRKLRVWAFHGARDDVVPESESQRMAEALRRAGNAPKLTIYPDLGHHCWDRVYGDREFYTWLLSHRL